MKILRKRYLSFVLAMLIFAGCSANSTSSISESTVSLESESLDLPEPDAEELMQLEKWDRTVQRNGHTYRYNSKLRTVLFMGVDTHEADAELKEEAFGNGGRSDVIGLLVLNPETCTTKVIMMSRDTITLVDVYTEDGEFMFTGEIQITMQYSIGNSHKRSCQLMKRTVSRTLLGIPITAYCSMTLDGIAKISDYLGGVTLTLEEDWTDINPSYTAGATITMNAEELEHFLRYRDIEGSGGNDVRMRRHGWFIRQMFTKISKLGSAGIETMLKVLDPYLESDMDGELIKQLSKFKMEGDILKVPGETRLGEEGYHDEYYIDTEAMKDLILDVFYIQKD